MKHVALISLSLAIVGCQGNETARPTMPPAARGGGVSGVAITPSKADPPRPRPGATSGPARARSAVDGLVGQTCNVTLTQSAPAIASGPRRDQVRGTLRSVDAEWVVLDVDGRPLLIPRGAVLAIQPVAAE